MMADELTMHEELTEWILFLSQLREIAIEMESSEQDASFIEKNVFNRADADYTLTFHSLDGRTARLFIEWGIKGDDDETL